MVSEDTKSGRGGTGIRVRLRSVWSNPWGFESLRPHKHYSSPVFPLFLIYGKTVNCMFYLWCYRKIHQQLLRRRALARLETNLRTVVLAERPMCQIANERLILLSQALSDLAPRAGQAHIAPLERLVATLCVLSQPKLPLAQAKRNYALPYLAVSKKSVATVRSLNMAMILLSLT